MKISFLKFTGSIFNEFKKISDVELKVNHAQYPFKVEGKVNEINILLDFFQELEKASRNKYSSKIDMNRFFGSVVAFVLGSVITFLVLGEIKYVIGVSDIVLLLTFLAIVWYTIETRGLKKITNKSYRLQMFKDAFNIRTFIEEYNRKNSIKDSGMVFVASEEDQRKMIEEMEKDID